LSEIELLGDKRAFAVYGRYREGKVRHPSA